MAGSKCPFSMYEHHGPGKSGTAEIHPIETLGSGGGIAAVGHKDPFPAPGLSGHCRFGQRTFAGRGCKEEERRKLRLPSLRMQAGEWASVCVLLQSSGRFGQLLLAAKAFAVAQVGRRCDPCLEAAVNVANAG